MCQVLTEELSDFLENADMFRRIITNDKEWCFHMRPGNETKIHTRQKKHMLIIRGWRPWFFDQNWIVRYKFIS